ncbi:MAG: cobalamin biosynthesis protein [Pseudobutyrivibrio sp.]|nr:cobalamin biosynthesis protein [Pseudobutyrivibrio sp.]
MFKYHILALFIGTILDYCFGRLYSLWNPFDSIRALIKYLDRALLGDEIILLEPGKQRTLGLWLVIIVLLPVFALSAFFTMLSYEIAPFVGVIFEAFASYLCLEGHRIFFGAKGVMDDYYGHGLKAMNYSASLLTGRDIEDCTKEQVTEEVITYVANESSDSVLSPLFIMFLFGPVGGFLYRTIDIIDGEIGHKDKRYADFGYYVARIDTLIDYIPGRISGAVALLATKYTFGSFNSKNARYIHLRDRNKAISVYAGALNISLKHGTVGDMDANPEPRLIREAVYLLRNSFIIWQVFLLILLVFF